MKPPQLDEDIELVLGALVLIAALLWLLSSHLYMKPDTLRPVDAFRIARSQEP